MKFNLNNMFRLMSVDRKYVLYCGAFLGKFSFTIFNNDKDSGNSNIPPGKIILYNDLLEKTIEYLTIALDKKEKYSISFQPCSYDYELKQNIPIANIIIGRDDELVIYIEMTTQGLKEPIRFTFEGMPSYMVNQTSPSKMEFSETNTKVLLRILAQNLIPICLTKDVESLKYAADLRKTNPNGVAQKTKDDIPF